MDTEIVQHILQNRRENKLMSKTEIEEERKMRVVDIYGEFIDFETNKENVYQTLDKLQNYRYKFKNLFSKSFWAIYNLNITTNCF